MILGANDLLADGPGLRVALLADVEEIGIAETWSDPGAPSSPPHLHHRHVESFYVLEGALAVAFGDGELRAEVGSWAEVPPGVAHTVSFPGSEPVRFLNPHMPSCGLAAFLRALHSTGDEVDAVAAGTAFDQHPLP